MKSIARIERYKDFLKISAKKDHKHRLMIFGNSWSGDFNMMKGIIRQTFKDSKWSALIDTYSVEVDNMPKVVESLGMNRQPCTVVFYNKEIIFFKSGALGKKELLTSVDKIFNIEQTR